MKPWKLALVAFGAGVAGVVVALLLWIAYTDHQRVTAMWQAMTQPRPATVAASPPEK